MVMQLCICISLCWNMHMFTQHLMWSLCPCRTSSDDRRILSVIKTHVCRIAYSSLMTRILTADPNMDTSTSKVFVVIRNTSTCTHVHFCCLSRRLKCTLTASYADWSHMHTQSLIYLSDSRDNLPSISSVDLHQIANTRLKRRN